MDGPYNLTRVHVRKKLKIDIESSNSKFVCLKFSAKWSANSARLLLVLKRYGFGAFFSNEAAQLSFNNI